MASKASINNCGIFRSGAWVGQFADQSITDTELEGGAVETSLLAAAVKLVDTGSLFSSCIHGWTDTAYGQVATIAANFVQCATLCAGSHPFVYPSDKFSSCVSRVSETLAALQIGEFATVPAGWAHLEGGHALLLLFQRTSDDLMSLTVCNSGGGLTHHPTSVQFYPKTKYRTAMHIGGLARPHVISPDTVTMLVKLKVVEQGHCASVFYSAVLPFICQGINLRDVLKDPELQDKHGDWETPQAAGTCYYRCILVALRYILKKIYGWTTIQVKQFMLVFRLAYLRHALGNLVDIANAKMLQSCVVHVTTVNNSINFWANEMARYDELRRTSSSPDIGTVLFKDALHGEAVPSFLDSDWKLVHVAVKSALRALHKLHAAGAVHIGGKRTDADTADIPDLSSGVHLVAEVSTVLASLAKGLNIEQAPALPYLQPLTSLLGAAAVPVGGVANQEAVTALELPVSSVLMSKEASEWQNFDLVQRIGDNIEPFAGGTTEGAPDLFVELRPPVGSSPSLWDTGYEPDAARWDLISILTSVSACVDQCDSLRARSEQGAASLLMLRELVALVEDLVHARLPMPRPFGDIHCSWRVENTRGGVLLSQQRSLLECVARLATHYLAACASLPEEEGKGSLLLTMAALVVFFDAAARVVATDALSPLTNVLSGLEPLATLESLSDEVMASAAMTSLPVAPIPKIAFGLSLIHMMEKEVTFLERISNERIVDPTLLLSRASIEAYVNSIHAAAGAGKNGPPIPFLYGCKPIGSKPASRAAYKMTMSSAFNVDPEAPTGMFVAAMCTATGRGDSMSPLLEAHVSSTEEVPTEAWRLGSWFVDQWIDVPEMAALRNLMLQFRFAASNMQTVKNLTVFDTGKATPRWMWSRGNIYCDMFGARVRNLSGVSMVKPVNISTFVCKLTPTGDLPPSTGEGIAAGVDGTALINSLPRPRVFLDPAPTEEDVCLTKQQHLYSFNGTFSTEDSARLAAILTAEYIRIPLLLQFFCTSRAGSLLHPEVRTLLESVLFDVLPVDERTTANTNSGIQLSGAYFTADSTGLSVAGSNAGEAVATMATALGPFTDVPVHPSCRGQLGSMYGALMQELGMNPAAVLRPLMRLLKSCRDLCTADYRSPFASLVVWVIRQLTRVESFALLMLRVKAVFGQEAAQLTSLLTEVRHDLTTYALPLMWTCIAQANKADDIIKCCLFNTACVMMFGNASAEELQAPFPLGLLPVTMRSNRVSMASIDDSNAGVPENGYFVLLSGIMYINAWYAHVPAPADRSSPSGCLVPFAGVYRALQRHRDSLLRWMSDMSAGSVVERDAALNALMRCTLRKPSASVLEWTPASALNQRCQLVLESPHPSPPGIDMYKRICFPGAPFITVRFEERSQLERVSDFIAFYKDTTYTSLWGGKKFSGQPGTDEAFSWPGACGKGPLIIPSDTIYVHFHTDATVSYWGFKCHFSAPVCPESIATISQWILDESIISLDDIPRDLNSIIANLLAEACNDVAEVKRAFRAGEWKRGPGSEITGPADVTADGRAEDASVKAGLYGDSVGRLELNIQTCELYVCKQLQNPVPLVISQHPDFQALFEDTQTKETSGHAQAGAHDSAVPSALTCTAICNNVHRKWIQMTKGVLTYDIQLWQPLKQGDEALLPEEADLVDGRKDAPYKELDDCYVSHGLPRLVEVTVPLTNNPLQQAAIEATAVDCFGATNKALCYRRRLYRTPYMLHTSQFGSDSVALDAIIQDAIENASLSKPPFIFLEDTTDESLSSKETCLLLYLPPQGDAPSARNGLGSFLDVRLRRSQKELGLPPQIFAYQIIDHARCAQRVLVYSSDNTFTLRQLDANTTNRWQPWEDATQNEAGKFFGALVEQSPKFSKDHTGWGKNLDDADPADEPPSTWPWISDISIDLHLEHASGMEVAAANVQIGGESEAAMRRLAARSEAPASAGSLHVSRYITLSEFSMGVRAPSAKEVKEVFVPCRDLSGMLPDAILRQYTFWQRDTQPTRKLVGYPRGEPPKLHHTAQPHGVFNSLGFDEEQLLQVTFESTDYAHATSEDRAASFAGEGERAARQLLKEAHLLTANDRSTTITFSRRLTLLNASRLEHLSLHVRQLLQALRRIESLSHTLIWGRAYTITIQGTPPFSGVLLESIELPRLHQSFRLQHSFSEQTVRVASVDNAGLYVCSIDVLHEIPTAACLPSTLALVNDERRIFVMSPSCGFSRPVVRQLPFSCRLMLQRSWEWIQYAQSRVHLFSVHHSNLYLTPPSLSASIYLFASHVLTRRYSEAASIAHMCASDVEYSQEQLWLFRLLDRSSVSDTDPGAIALRLRSILMRFISFANTKGAPSTVPSPYSLLQAGNGDVNGSAFQAFLAAMKHHTNRKDKEGGIDVDYQRYLQRRQHVPGDVKLSLKEEMQLQALVAYMKADVQAIQNRDHFLQAAIEGTPFTPLPVVVQVPGADAAKALTCFADLVDSSRRQADDYEDNYSDGRSLVCPTCAISFQCVRTEPVSRLLEFCLPLCKRKMQEQMRASYSRRPIDSLFAMLYDCLTYCEGSSPEYEEGSAFSEQERTIIRLTQLSDGASEYRKKIAIATAVIDMLVAQIGSGGFGLGSELQLLKVVAHAAAQDIAQAVKWAVLQPSPPAQQPSSMRRQKPIHAWELADQAIDALGVREQQHQRRNELLEAAVAALSSGSPEDAVAALTSLRDVELLEIEPPPYGPTLSCDLRTTRFPAFPYERIQELIPAEGVADAAKAQYAIARVVTKWWDKLVAAAKQPERQSSQSSEGSGLPDGVQQLIMQDTLQANRNLELETACRFAIADYLDRCPALTQFIEELSDGTPAKPIISSEISADAAGEQDHVDLRTFVAQNFGSLLSECGVIPPTSNPPAQNDPRIHAGNCKPSNTNCVRRSVTVASDAARCDLREPLHSLRSAVVQEEGVDANRANLSNAAAMLEHFSENQAKASTPSGRAIIGRLSNAVHTELAQPMHAHSLACLTSATLATAIEMSTSGSTPGAQSQTVSSFQSAHASILEMCDKLTTIASTFRKEASRLEQQAASAFYEGGGSLLPQRTHTHDSLLFGLQQYSRDVPSVMWPVLIGLTLSDNAHADAQRLNAVLTAEQLDNLVFDPLLHAMLLRVNSCHAMKALSTARQVVKCLENCLEILHGFEATATDQTVLAKQWHCALQILMPNTGTLCEQLLAVRPYLDDDTSTAVAFDPRLLFAEFHIGSLLRPRQVTLVNDFMTAATAGGSRVEQAIMGLGKTYVIAPLLGLMLADGNRMVTQAMPAQLLSMSCDAVRSFLSSPAIFKQVAVYRFDRSMGGTATVAKSVPNSTLELFPDSASPPKTLFGAGFGTKKTTQRVTKASAPQPQHSLVPNCLKKSFWQFISEAYSGNVPSAVGDERTPIWPYPGCQLDAGLLTLACIHTQLQGARLEGHVTCSSPDSLKSTVLRYLDLLQLEQEHTGDAPRPCPSAQLLNKIINHFRGNQVASHTTSMELTSFPSVAILDEVDFLMHPLRSELNFPTGRKHALPLSPLRWKLPMQLIRLVLAVGQSAKTQAPVEPELFDMLGSNAARQAINQLRATILQGFECRALQDKPHLTLLNIEWYRQNMKPLVAHLAWDWLMQHVVHQDIAALAGYTQSHFASQPQAATDIAVAFLSGNTAANGADGEVFPGCSRSAADAILNETLSAHSLSFLNLAQQWVVSNLAHVLSKVNRVNFGLLNESTSRLTRADEPLSRLLLAVPFVGKDVPSHASEYSHPDIRIGLTFAAYTFEGLRSSDTDKIARSLKKSFTQESGSFKERPSKILFDQFVAAAKAVGAPRLQRQSSLVRGGGGRSDGDPHTAALQILPLEYFQPHDPDQLRLFYTACCRVPALVAYYLDNFVFPSTTDAQIVKLSTSGHDLGSDMLFGCRLGFTGTPNEMVPFSLLPVQFDAASEASVISTLLSTSNVQCSLVINWDILGLLQNIAVCEAPKFNAFIDIGALITGLSNKSVAAALLCLGLKNIDGVIYLDESDKRVVLLRPRIEDENDNDVDEGDEAGSEEEEAEEPSEPSKVPISQQPTFASIQQLITSAPYQALLRAPAIPLSMCGVPLHRLFTFFDSYHSTGTDIPQAVDAVAAVTVSKDTSFRDYCQGAYRMRGLGRGQQIHVLLTDEIATLAVQQIGSAKLHAAAIGATELVTWLLLNSIRGEALQQLALVSQRTSYVWRGPALRALLHSHHPDLSSLRFDTATPACKLYTSASELTETSARDFSMACIDSFNFPLDHSLPPTIAPAPSFTEVLVNEQRRHSLMLQVVSQHEKAQLLDCMSHAHAATVAAQGYGNLAHDTEQVQEQEQQQELQQEQQEEKMDQSPVDPVGVTPWHLLCLTDLAARAIEACTPWPWSRLSAFVTLNGEQLPFSADCGVSSNHTRASNKVKDGEWILPRRLRDVNILLAVATVSSSRIVAITLREAESLRHSLLRCEACCRGTPKEDASTINISLLLMDGTADVTTLLRVSVPSLSDVTGAPRSTVTQDALVAQLKLFDGALFLSQQQAKLLLTAVQGAPTAIRRMYFEAVRQRRRRDVAALRSSPLSAVFTFAALEDWEASQALIASLHQHFVRQYGSLAAAFDRAVGTTEKVVGPPRGSMLITDLISISALPTESLHLLNTSSGASNLEQFLRDTVQSFFGELVSLEIRLRYHEFVQIFTPDKGSASVVDIPLPPQRPMLSSRMSSVQSASVHGLVRMPSTHAPLTRQHSLALKAAAESAKSNNSRQSYRRMLQGLTNLSHAADFGTLFPVGFQSDGGDGDESSPLVCIDADRTITVNQLPRAFGVAPTQLAGALNVGSVACAPRGVILADDTCFFAAQLRTTASSNFSTLSSPPVATALGGIGVVATDYSGGLPGGPQHGSSKAESSATPGVSIVCRSMREAKPRYCIAHQGTYSEVLDADGRPFIADYSDVLGCGMDCTTNPPTIHFSINGRIVARVSTPFSSTSSGLLPVGWMSHWASHASFPFGLRFLTGSRGDTGPALADGAVEYPVNVAAVPPAPIPGHAPIQQVLHNRLAHTLIRQSGASFGRLVPTSGANNLILTPPAEGLCPPERMEWSMTGKSEFPSCILAGVVLSTGRWYWEAHVTEAGLAQAGWADVSFIGASDAGMGVGDDKSSWSYDGKRTLTWFDGSRAWGRAWQENDVIGFVADLDARVLSFGLNGDYITPMGHAFLSFDFKGGIAPAVTVQANQFAAHLNFGQGGRDSFRCKLPPGCRPVWEWVEEHQGGISYLSPSAAIRESSNPTALSLLRNIGRRAEAVSGAASVVCGSARLMSLLCASSFEDPLFNNMTMFTSTTGYPTVLLYPLSSESSQLHTKLTTDLVIAQCGEFGIGFACPCTFHPSWSEDLGVGEVPNSFGVINLHKGRMLPKMITRDVSKGLGALHTFKEHSTALTAPRPAPRCDMALVSGLYVTRIDHDGKVAYERLGDALPSFSRLSLSMVQGAAAGHILQIFHGDVLLLTHEAEGIRDWVPALTVAPASIIGVVCNPV